MTPIHVKRTPWLTPKKTSLVSSSTSSAPAQVAGCEHRSRSHSDNLDLTAES